MHKMCCTVSVLFHTYINWPRLRDRARIEVPISSATGNLANGGGWKGFQSHQKRESSARGRGHYGPINSSKYRRKKNSVVMERPAKTRPRAKKINGKREEMNARAPTWPIEEVSALGTKRRKKGNEEWRRAAAGGEEEQQEGECASSNSSGGGRGRMKGREEGAIGACARPSAEDVAMHLSLPPFSVLALFSLARQPFPSVSRALVSRLGSPGSLSSDWRSWTQVRVGGGAWYPPPIGYRVLPTPEVGRRRRKEGRNEGRRGARG